MPTEEQATHIPVKCIGGQRDVYDPSPLHLCEHHHREVHDGTVQRAKH